MRANRSGANGFRERSRIELRMEEARLVFAREWPRGWPYARGTTRCESGSVRHQLDGHVTAWAGPSPLSAMSQPTQCIYIGLWRGDAAPPFEPPAPAPLPEQRTDGGVAPGPPQWCAPSAAAHHCGRHPRHTGRPAHRGGGPPGAERSLDAFDRIEEPAAAGDVTRRRLHPPEGGLFAFPQGSLAP